ncbi:DUF1624 domain-containing protein [Siccibacter colletis]|uniref:DUF1624 domain-containing protein n=1 Tax=Siccibacter colletis TaxID=1505757 RepID=A0ABY6JDN4_9ENTR|nr:DUF1624 domain-containing protein [Siccibacter colletis]UYU31931.1 DUF1624 domain-containing protein [Siccibacter colletis]
MSGVLSRRLVAIDALRGLVMLLMLLDHVRETFFLHRQVGDPMDVTTTEPALFIGRTLAHLCAPVFVFLTGLSAALYWQKTSSLKKTAEFLFKRGLVLILLEITLVNFAWTFQFPPSVVYLQVIWAIGLSMVALSALIWLPAGVLLPLAVVIIAGHNLLDGIHAAPGSFWAIPWAILHDRGWIELGDAMRVRTSYPVLPWIGVISLGFLAGRFYRAEITTHQRQRLLAMTGVAALAAFVVLRLINGYGEKPWVSGENSVQTVMSFFNITKYPPSLMFLLLTLSLGLLLLALFERFQDKQLLVWIGLFGAAPMFFYLLHLYVLKALYLMAVAIWGLNHGEFFGFDTVWQVWLGTIALAAALVVPVRRFAAFKARRRDITWLKYF